MEGERVGRWDKGAIWPGKGVGGDCDVGREVFVLPVAHPGRITPPLVLVDLQAARRLGRA